LLPAHPQLTGSDLQAGRIRPHSPWPKTSHPQLSLLLHQYAPTPEEGQLKNPANGGDSTAA
jgi:hypothetical protein